MSKTLLEILNKYHPSPKVAELLEQADPDSLRVRADRDNRMLEVCAAFPKYISKSKL